MNEQASGDGIASGSGSSRVLLVDDEAIVSRALSAALSRAGYVVVACADGAEAARRLEDGNFDVVVSDIMMPELDGIGLLRAIRERDRDVPVILMTGAPSVESAVRAIDCGAFKYLLKPVARSELVEAVGRAARFHRLAALKRRALSVLGTSLGEGADRSGLEVSFENALETLWIAFQPIVRAADRTVFGYEALMRSDEPSLPHPGAVLDAAQRLDDLPRLGRIVRDRAAAPMLQVPGPLALFVNLHPSDLLDDHLFSANAALSGLASRVVLEVTERASLERVSDVRRRVRSLRDLGFRIAVDDLGAGYAGLSSFAHLEPEIVKFDMSLVRDIDTSTVKQKLVRSMTAMCRDLGLLVVAEGIETESERDTLVDLGCDLLQGYRFGRPARPFVEAAW